LGWVGAEVLCENGSSAIRAKGPPARANRAVAFRPRWGGAHRSAAPRRRRAPAGIASALTARVSPNEDEDQDLAALPSDSLRPLDTPRWLRSAASVGWRLLVLAGVAYIAAWTVQGLSGVVLPFALGLFVAALAEPAVERLRRVRVPRAVSAFTLLLLLVAAVAGAASLFAWGMTREASTLGTNLTDGWTKVTQGLGTWLPFVDGEWLRERSLAALQSAGDDMGEVVKGALTVGTVVSQAGFTLVFAFFFLKDGPGLTRRAIDEVPEDRRPLVRRLAERTWHTMGAYLRGVAMVATFNSLLTGAAMWAIGIPMIGPVMVVTFVGSFVPYAGTAVAMALASLLAVANGGVVDMALIVSAMAAIQAFEGNVLQPYVVGEAVQLHPVAVLFAVTAGAILGGLAGAFLAVPVVASVTAAYEVITRAPRVPDEAPLSQDDESASPEAARRPIEA